MKRKKDNGEAMHDREAVARLKALVPLVISSRQRMMLREVIARMGGRSRH